MAKRRAPIAVVTGGNRGIGLEICRQLAQRGCRVILGSRDPAKGRAAAKALAAEGLDVSARALDVSDPASVRRFGRALAKDPGRVDILVNNAGVYLDSGYDAEGRVAPSGLATTLGTLDATLRTNLHGPLLMIQAVLPLMLARKHGRIVNVSSGSGQLATMGGGELSYRLSKTALNALTRVIAAETTGTGVLVNACCPGWVRTDMGGPHARRSVEEGADTPVWLATLPAKGPTGGFFRDREPIPW
jgi:NAD(P)-dependent dehydrogenase (short-subunit alcohol dehydrogenase family)